MRKSKNILLLIMFLLCGVISYGQSITWDAAAGTIRCEGVAIGTTATVTTDLGDRSVEVVDRTSLIALRNAVPKIIVFLLSVMLLIVILGTIMYIFEGLGGDNPGFQDIPNSIYWSIVTLTTVGYGTVVPVTVIGKIIASVIIVVGIKSFKTKTPMEICFEENVKAYSKILLF